MIDWNKPIRFINHENGNTVRFIGFIKDQNDEPYMAICAYVSPANMKKEGILQVHLDGYFQSKVEGKPVPHIFDIENVSIEYFLNIYSFDGMRMPTPGHLYKTKEDVEKEKKLFGAKDFVKTVVVKI